MSLNTILATAPLTTTNYILKATGTTIGNSSIFDNGTNVGIGNTNTSYTLDVSGTGRFTGALTGGGNITTSLSQATSTDLSVSNTSASNGAMAQISAINGGASQIDMVAFGSGSTGTLYGITKANLKVIRDNSLTAQSNGLAIGTDAAVPFYVFTNSVERMRITSAGNVGIATSSPDTLLTVNGTSGTKSFALVNSGGGTRADFTITENDGLYINSNEGATARNIILQTGGTERMRITSGGNVNVGIGSAVLEVGSTGLNGKVGIRFGGTGKVGIDTRDDDDTSNCTYIFFRKADGTGIGSITRSGLTNAVLYNTTSDYRLKEDFKEINGLEKISKIKVYDFKWVGFEDRMDGVIAHELQEIMPYAVHGGKDAIDEDGNIKAQGVDYSKLVPILIKSIQEQQIQIQNLQEQINILAK